MNKKVIARILVALAAYGVFVGLVVNFYDDSPAKMQWEDREAYNRQFIAKLALEKFNMLCTVKANLVTNFVNNFSFGNIRAT